MPKTILRIVRRIWAHYCGYAFAEWAVRLAQTHTHAHYHTHRCVCRDFSIFTDLRIREAVAVGWTCSWCEPCARRIVGDCRQTEHRATRGEVGMAHFVEWFDYIVPGCQTDAASLGSDHHTDSAVTTCAIETGCCSRGKDKSLICMCWNILRTFQIIRYTINLCMSRLDTDWIKLNFNQL